MSTGTICLKCRKYIKAVDPKWQCSCEEPEPSEDGKHPIDEAFDKLFNEMLTGAVHSLHSTTAEDRQALANKRNK
jgi:hypothetical protein